MGIETKIKYLGVPQTKILDFSFSTGGHFEKWPKREVSPSFVLATSRIPFLKYTEGNDTTHGGSWGGGGCMGTPLAYGLIFFAMETCYVIQIDANSCKPYFIGPLNNCAIWVKSMTIWRFKTNTDKIMNLIDFI